MTQRENLLSNNNEDELTHNTKPFDFKEFFHTTDEMLGKMRSRNFITNSIYRVCPRPLNR